MHKAGCLAFAFGFLWIAPALTRQGSLAASPDAPYFKVYRRSIPITRWPPTRPQQEIPELAALELVTDQSRLPEILRRVADSLQDFIFNFVNTAALETIEQTRRPKHGEKTENIVQRYRYLMLLRQEGEAQTLSEYRTDLHGREEPPRGAGRDFLKTAGFAALSLFFGSLQQSWSDFRYLGQQSLNGRRTEVVAFAEHVEPAAVMGRFDIGGASVPILVEGVAWISAGDFQIVQIRTDLLAPLPGVSLWRLTTVVRFTSKQFKGAAVAFWLPQDVDVTVEQGQAVFTNHHHYSDYQLFKVEIVPTANEPQPISAPNP